MKTRPCKPGDALAIADSLCGARYEVRVAEPTKHPSSGCTEDHQVNVVLAVMAPCEAGGPFLRADLRQETMVLEEKCWDRWGDLVQRLDGAYRAKHVRFVGPAIAPLVHSAVEQGEEALRQFDAVSSAHASSVERQRTARQAAYAAWPVSDES